MIAIAKKSARKFPLGWKRRFEELMPSIQRTARFAFRNFPPSEREEATCEVVANAFCAFRRLAELGKIEVAFAGALARFAIAQYGSGRRVGTSLTTTPEPRRQPLGDSARGRVPERRGRGS